MRLIKPNNYEVSEMNIAYLGDALSHPVRKRIIHYLHETPSNTRADFSKLFNLSKPVVGQHIQKLVDAGLIRFNYSLHFERIELRPEAFRELMDFLIEVGVEPIKKHSETPEKPQK